jgi:hypothetical protein
MENKSYYFKRHGCVIFDDIAYASDHPYWLDHTSWHDVPGFTRYEATVHGEIVRKRDAFLLIPNNGYVMLTSDTGIKTRCAVSDILAHATPVDTTGAVLDALLAELTGMPEQPEHPEFPESAYLEAYPIVILDSSGVIQRWHPSIIHMLANTHGTEGMDPQVIYRACVDGVKCYGKNIRWDPNLYVKYELLRCRSRFPHS